MFNVVGPCSYVCCVSVYCSASSSTTLQPYPPSTSPVAPGGAGTAAGEAEGRQAATLGRPDESFEHAMDMLGQGGADVGAEWGAGGGSGLSGVRPVASSLLVS